jgi:phospholipid/cholesterol/gamma-HCH transport system substrate-binding protein
MRRARLWKLGLAATLVAVVVAGVVVVVQITSQHNRIHVTAFFDNSNGVFVGDDVRIRGVNVGKIDSIEPQPSRAKIGFWIDAQYPVPADAKVVILSPTLVTARAIQLTPAYHGGPTMTDGAVIERNRTAVPMEWDDFRNQLQRLAATLQPSQPGSTSPLGELINSTADNVRGRGQDIRNSIVQLSQAISILGDHSTDAFTSVKNLATLTSALQNSTDLIRELNQNLASATGLLSNTPNEVGNTIHDLNDVVGEVKTFVADNRETLGITTDKVSSVSQTLNDSRDDIEQLLHVLPTTAANAINTYQPAQGLISGVLAVNNFSNPINFICGAIQAASRLGAEQSSKLCVQYLAPIVKNRQYNFPPFGLDPVVGPSVRPNEVTYSEDWMRPDYVPPQPASPQPAAVNPADPLPAEAATPPVRQNDPAAGLPGLMVPAGAGS